MRAVSGKEFKDIVRSHGLTGKVVAEEAGMRGDMISRWVTGRKINITTYNRLIDALERLLAKKNG